nr:NPCBM/NEW2 domain-containing protein [Paenibacillus pasadenensis]
MGWNSFDTFFDNEELNEANVKEIADYMAANLKDSGYINVNLDGGWWTNEGRGAIHIDEYGRPIPGVTRFPSAAGGAGLKPLADYVHSLGLKLGIYAMRGIPRAAYAADVAIKGTSSTAKDITNTSDVCYWNDDNYGLNWADYPDESQAYYDSLFELWESWGVDYVKIDDLTSPFHLNDIKAYSQARENVGSDIIISGSPGDSVSEDQVQTILQNMDLFRSTGDVWDNWNDTNKQFDPAKKFASYAGEGAWIDLDMLPFGKIRSSTWGEIRQSLLTKDEIYTSMTLHAIARSPLIMGGDPRALSNDDFTLDVLTNPEVLAVNQTGDNQRAFYDQNNITKWVSDAGNGEKYIALFNRTAQETKISFDFSDVQLPQLNNVRNLWTRSNIGTFSDRYSVVVPSHGAALLKVTPTTIDEAIGSLDISLSTNPVVISEDPVQLTSVLKNDGLVPIRDVTANIQLPAGWIAEAASSNTFEVIEVGETVTIEWIITPTAASSFINAQLSATAQFIEAGNTRELSGSTSVMVYPKLSDSNIPFAPTHYLSDLEWSYSSHAWGPIEKDMTVGGSGSNDGTTIKLDGINYVKGLGTNSPCKIIYILDGRYAKFTSVVGIDDSVNNGSVVFEVHGDGKKLWDSGHMTANTPAKTIDVDITGVNFLLLVVTDGGDGSAYDNADWANAMIHAQLSSDTSLASAIGTVSAGGTANETITNIPNGTTLAELKAAITLAEGATFKVYDADGTTEATTLTTGSKVIVTAQDGTTKVTYTVTVNAALSQDATLSSTIGTVSAGGTANETITNIPNGTTLAELKAAITLAEGATFKVYDADGTTEATTLRTGSKVIVTAQDGISKVTYTVTVEVRTPSGFDGPVIPSDIILKSMNGKLTLPAGKAGQVSLDDEIMATIPALATGRDATITIEKVTDTQKLLANDEVPVSKVFELLKNFTGNFLSPIMITFRFDSAKLKSDQTPAVFYYDEVKKSWIKVNGGKVSGNNISVTVDYFTKFAVFAVDQSDDEPTKNPESETRFSDIAGHWGEANIKQAVNIGLIKGYADGTFKPNHTVTRAEFAAMLINAFKPQGTGTELFFNDAANIGPWAKSLVAQAVQAGYMKGYADGTFRPNSAITRAEMAVAIANAAELSMETNASIGFKDDKDIPTWAKDAVAAMKKIGIVEGNGANIFNPDAKTTRIEAVTVLLKIIAEKVR